MARKPPRNSRHHDTLPFPLVLWSPASSTRQSSPLRGRPRTVRVHGLVNDRLRVGYHAGVRSSSIPARWRLALAILARLPKGALSRLAGRLARIPIPRVLRRPLLGVFARSVGADLSEIEQPLEEYPSLNRFFIRRLRPGARVVTADSRLAISPVDGLVSQQGTIDKGQMLQVKGLSYSAADLLGDPAQGNRFDGGCYATIYLTPRHYHRIHAPCAGSIVAAQHVPGALWPVNRASVARIPQLFPRNERLICHLEGPLGRVAVVAVGAFNVGCISAAFDPEWNQSPRSDPGVTNRYRAAASDRCYEPPVPIGQGDEIMAFQLGSTVVLLFEPGRVRLAEDLEPGRELLFGEPIAHAR